MSKQPHVSVIMPVRNEGKFLKRAIDSILVAGGAIESLEVIVVDGMSDDDTRSVVAELQREDDRILLLENQRRTVPHAMNLGIRAASADVVVRVDGHAEVYPDFLKE
ncbi:MAG TPA: glycosyltransferase, partial [Trueperaceae bacterium]|nr:glycosyltransferase [Trueperaceae bacterium]